MKELAVISGKGGTGKTTISASFAALEPDKIMADADVDASDLHLILKPKVIKREEFICGKTARIIDRACIMCGECEKVCRFNAVKNFIIDSIACEGCGFCYQVCPKDAIIMEDNLSGHWFLSDTKYGKMVHASLGAGEENSGRLVSLVRKQAKEIAEKEKKELIIIDGPPGTGCPVLSSITGTDLVLIVTEPTCSGLHDLKRILEVVFHFNIQALVCINKWDINKEVSEDIKKYCLDKGVDVVGKIPFHESVVEALVKGKSVVENYDNEVTEEIKKMWDKIKNNLGGNEKMKKIALPTAQGKFSMHFGHCERFAVFEIEGKEIKNKMLIKAPAHSPGVLPKFLCDNGVTCIIAGGIGMRAQEIFAVNGIEVIVGAMGTDPDEVIKAYLAGTLETGANVCDH